MVSFPLIKYWSPLLFSTGTARRGRTAMKGHTQVFLLIEPAVCGNSVIVCSSEMRHHMFRYIKNDNNAIITVQVKHDPSSASCWKSELLLVQTVLNTQHSSEVRSKYLYCPLVAGYSSGNLDIAHKDTHFLWNTIFYWLKRLRTESINCFKNLLKS